MDSNLIKILSSSNITSYRCLFVQPCENSPQSTGCQGPFRRVSKIKGGVPKQPVICSKIARYIDT